LIDSDPKIKALLTQNPKWRGCIVSVDVDVPGQHGEGVGGRVAQLAGSRDNNGPFQFGPRPEEAPVVHFSGPWQITFYSADSPWHIGATEKPYLAMGTPGLGSGATAFVGYEGVIPPGLKPTLSVRFPPAEGRSPTARSFQLANRCCTINL